MLFLRPTAEIWGEDRKKKGKRNNDMRGSWDSVVRIVTTLRAERSKRTAFRFLVGARNYSHLKSVQTGSVAHPATCSMENGWRNVKLTTRFQLIPRLRMSGAIPLLHNMPQGSVQR